MRMHICFVIHMYICITYCITCNYTPQIPQCSIGNVAAPDDPRVTKWTAALGKNIIANPIFALSASQSLTIIAESRPGNLFRDAGPRWASENPPNGRKRWVLAHCGSSASLQPLEPGHSIDQKYTEGIGTTLIPRRLKCNAPDPAQSKRRYGQQEQEEGRRNVRLWPPPPPARPRPRRRAVAAAAILIEKRRLLCGS